MIKIFSSNNTEIWLRILYVLLQLFHKDSPWQEVCSAISCSWCCCSSFYKIYWGYKDNACDLAPVTSYICSEVSISSRSSVSCPTLGYEGLTFIIIKFFIESLSIDFFNRNALWFAYFSVHLSRLYVAFFFKTCARTLVMSFIQTMWLPPMEIEIEES